MAGPAPAAMPAQLAPAGSVLSPGQQAALGATNKSFTGIAGTSGSGAGVLPLGTPAPGSTGGGGLQGPPPLPSEDPVGSYASAYNSYLNQAKQQLNQSLVGSLQGIRPVGVCHAPRDARFARGLQASLRGGGGL